MPDIVVFCMSLVAVTVEEVPGLVDELEHPPIRSEVAAKRTRPKNVLVMVSVIWNLFFMVINIIFL